MNRYFPKWGYKYKKGTWVSSQGGIEKVSDFCFSDLVFLEGTHFNFKLSINQKNEALQALHCFFSAVWGFKT